MGLEDSGGGAENNAYFRYFVLLFTFTSRCVKSAGVEREQSSMKATTTVDVTTPLGFGVVRGGVELFVGR